MNNGTVKLTQSPELPNDTAEPPFVNIFQKDCVMIKCLIVMVNCTLLYFLGEN